MCAYYIQPFGKIARLFAPPADEEKTFEFLKNPERFLKHRTLLSINKDLLPLFEKKSVYSKQTDEAVTKDISNCPHCALGHDSNKSKIWKLNEMQFSTMLK
jgi:hypothetical protein